MALLQPSERARSLLRGLPGPLVVTGANGWLGHATLELLLAALGPASFQARVVALGSRAAEGRLADGTRYPIQALQAWAPAAGARAWVFHYAFLTMDRVAGMDSSAYMAGNVAIRDTVLGWIRAGAVEAAFVPSSGAVYDALSGTPRSPQAALYGQLKLDDEAAFSASGVRLVMPRVFNLSGAYINKFSAYALASFIASLQQGQPIAIQARKPVLRSYYALGDLLELGLAMLADPACPGPQVFDTAGLEAIELEALAQAVLAALPQFAAVPVTRAELDPAAAPDRYLGERTALAALEQRYGIIPSSLEQQIQLTSASIAHTLAAGATH